MLCKNFHLDSMNVMVLRVQDRLSVIAFGSERMSASGMSEHWISLGTKGWDDRIQTQEHPGCFQQNEGKQNKQRNLFDLWLIHVAVWQGLTQYCKAIIPQLKPPPKHPLCLHDHDHNSVTSEKVDAFAAFNFLPSPSSPSLPAGMTELTL